MLSASRSWMWLRRSSRFSAAIVLSSTAAVAVMFLQMFEGNKKPAAAERLRRGVWGIPVSLVVSYPIVRRGAQQHAQQATGMEQRLIGSTIRMSGCEVKHRPRILVLVKYFQRVDARGA